MQFEFELRFADGVTEDRMVDLPVVGAAAGATTSVLVSNLPESDAIDRSDRMVEAAADAVLALCYHQDIELSDDPRSIIETRWNNTVGSVGASDAQRRKFEQFVNLDAHLDAIAATRRYIELSDLDTSDLGTTWGVTVCPNGNDSVLVRLNVGPREVMTIRGDGWMRLYLCGDPADLANAPGPTTTHDGFGRLPGSHAIGLATDHAVEWLEQSAELRAQHRELIERSIGPRIRNNWHNPLVNDLLRLEEPAAGAAAQRC